MGMVISDCKVKGCVALDICTVLCTTEEEGEEEGREEG